MSNDDRRNVALIAHVDHGKSTVVDSILREGTRVHRFAQRSWGE